MEARVKGGEMIERRGPACLDLLNGFYVDNCFVLCGLQLQSDYHIWSKHTHVYLMCQQPKEPMASKCEGWESINIQYLHSVQYYAP